MYNEVRMKQIVTVLIFASMWFVSAAQPVALSLPPVAYADTEVVTNVPLPLFVAMGGAVRVFARLSRAAHEQCRDRVRYRCR